MLAAKQNTMPTLSMKGSDPEGTPIVIALGMHRSGTSLCSQILSLLGVDMAVDVGAGRGNEAGHWERWEIVEFHDRILRILDRDYYSGTHDLALPNGWWAIPEVRVVQRELEDFIRAQIRPGHVFGFKDPRTARLLPLWTPIFRALNLDPRFIFCVRSPTQVARSLEDRDGLPLQMGEYRWAVYNTECWRNLRAEACTIVYDSWFESRDETLGRLVAFLSDVIDVNLRTVAQAVDAQIDRSLRHDRPGSERIRQPAMRYFYGLLCQENQDDETRLAIDRFVDQFAAFQQIIPFEGAVRAAADRDAAHAMAQAAAQAAKEVQNESIVAAAEAQTAHAAEIASLRLAVGEAKREVESVRLENEALQAEILAARGVNETSAEAERCAAVAADKARRESEELRVRYTAAEDARVVAVSEADRHAVAADEVRQHNAALRARLAALERHTHAEIQGHQKAYADLMAWIASFQGAITASWSWRLTRPLRRVGIARAALPPPPNSISPTRQGSPAPSSQVSVDGPRAEERNDNASSSKS